MARNNAKNIALWHYNSRRCLLRWQAKFFVFFYSVILRIFNRLFYARKRGKESEKEKEKELWNLFQDTSQPIWSRSSSFSDLGTAWLAEL
jgi:hypothetical protein